MAKKQDLIAYCGLYCGDCFGYKQTVADLARDLRKELRSYRFDLMADALAEVPFFKEFKDYEKCYNLLGTMVKFRCKKTCKGNGGPPQCKIRNCARKKKLDGCWQCDDFPTCEKLKILELHHGAAMQKNLRKLKKQGPAAFIKGKKYCTHQNKALRIGLTVCPVPQDLFSISFCILLAFIKKSVTYFSYRRLSFQEEGIICMRYKWILGIGVWRISRWCG